VAAVALTLTALAHGPIAMLGPGSLLVLVVGEQVLAPLAERVSDCAQAQGARVLLLGGTASLQQRCSDHVPGAPLADALQPIALCVPGQLLAEELSRRLGYEPDAPRGLSKITRTDTWNRDG
jgi:glucosamine--fructose-6-phosphate aminotransferase (isomerizing)